MPARNTCIMYDTVATPTPLEVNPKQNKQNQKSNPAEIRHALDIIMDDGTYEIRTTGRNFVGFFNDKEKAAEAAILVSGAKGVDGVFMTINPVNPALIARTGGKDLIEGSSGTSAQDVIRRRCLALDFDAVRPSGISSTEDEKAASLTRAFTVQEYLSAQGWPIPMVADSGNGTHLRYRIDLPNDKESRGLIDGVLKSLSNQFSDDTVKIDTRLGDAPRILKIPGTLVAKGVDTPARPHRVCAVINDGERVVVTASQLKAVAGASAPVPQASDSVAETSTYIKTIKDGLKLNFQTYVRHNWTSDEIEAFLDAYGKGYSRLDYKGGWKWQVTCINDPSHESPDACIYLTPNAGKFLWPTYSCSHDSCQSIEPKFGWAQFVTKLRSEQPTVTFEYPEDRPANPAQKALEPTDDEMFAIFHTEFEYDNAKPIVFAILNWLQEDAVTFLGGLSGHAKTLILLAMCRALLTGDPLFNHPLFTVPEKAERIVYLIPESTLTPFKQRMKLFGLEDFFRDKKFLFRTLSSEMDVDLTDPRILKAAKGAHVFLDTAVRFMDGEEVVDSKKFAETVFRILKTGARSVTAAHHSAKAFDKATYMSLENILRGSGDIGALCATVWGVKQTDKNLNQVVVQNCKPRDFQPCEPFVIQGRPFIEDTGTFRVVATDVCSDGKAATFSSLIWTQTMLDALETYEPDKRKKVEQIVNDHSKNVSNKNIAAKLSVSPQTIANWLNEFNEKVAAKKASKTQETL